MSIDPDVIEKAPGPAAGVPNSADIARQEAAAARNDAAVGTSEFRSTLGRHVTPEEFKLIVASIIVLLGFTGLVVMMCYLSDMRQAAWSLLVALVSGAAAAVFGSKLMGGGN